jgi:hypothetical protein
MAVGMTGLFDGELPDAAEVTGGTAAMGTDGLPAARPPGAVEGGAGVTLVAGTTGLPGVGLPGAIEGGRATLAARFGLPAAGALDAAESAGGVTMAAGTATLSAARSPGGVEGGGAILVARTLGLRAARPPGRVEGAGATVAGGSTGWLTAGLPDATEDAGVTLVTTTELPGAGAVEGRSATLAAGTTGLPGARPSGATEDGSGGMMAAGNVGSAGTGCGIAVAASTTGLSCATGSAGGIDGVAPFLRRDGISADFPTGGATLTSALGFELCAVPLRQRFGWEAAVREACAFPGLVFFLRASLVGNDFPRRRTPGGSSQIHFTAPLPPSVRMKFLSSRRCISSITQRFV